MKQQQLRRGLLKIIRRPGFWLLFVLFALITVVHYSQFLQQPAFLTQIMSDLGLERQAFERILYLAPILWSGFMFGYGASFLVSVAALAAMLPRAISLSQFPRDALFETGAVFIMGNLVAVSFEMLKKERERRMQLAALNQTSGVISKSLELGQVLDSSIDEVMNVMKLDAALIYLLDETSRELVLTDYRQVSPRIAKGIDRIKLGEGFNGLVAETGNPLFVEDASKDQRVTRDIIKSVGIQSLLIVPLKSKGKVVGTLAAVMRTARQFRRDELELLTAIGNQVGMAIENARLFEKEREVAAQLRASEERYRELFENAHDAIWLDDLDGKIIVANRSLSTLTGYSREELFSLKADRLIAPGSVKSIREIEDSILHGEAKGRLSELTLARKDGTEAFAQLSTSPVLSSGKVIGFQHIARDVTEEKRMKENLSFYLGQITRAQEEERKRIARELHDDTVQALVVLSRQLDGLTDNKNGLSSEQKRLVDSLWQQTNSIMDGVRRLSQDLRPATLDRLGLVAAIEWLTSDISKYSGIKIETKVLGAERRLPQEVELLLFRITQEAVRNVWRHSHATGAEVTISFGNTSTRITVNDNGTGFDVSEANGDLTRVGKLGLAGMKERARLLGGSLTVESSPSKGTALTVEAPA